MIYVIAGLVYAFGIWLGYSFGRAAGIREGGDIALNAMKSTETE